MAGKFSEEQSTYFKGRCDPKDSQTWLQKFEKIFRVMACTDAHKILFEMHMLFEEDEYLWKNAHQREDACTDITWDNFKREFLEKYFSDDVHNKKKIEFLKLKQGNMTVVDYVAKFEELSRFFPYYNGVGEESKGVKFESGLHPKIRQFIGYLEIRQFSMLVNKCMIYDEDICVRSAHYKSVSKKKNGN
ncbi:uncharacterized protein LOC127113967 [Lathyrus oleraceus]|uniref:uncharacterized protein LOC127113967 n=1 Tax=Pisum sativum TaxID=3888 RepID=UPI0021D36AFB|nr:uncharacterized protein LOC127113967 [Pisum sativum]